MSIAADVLVRDRSWILFAVLVACRKPVPPVPPEIAVDAGVADSGVAAASTDAGVGCAAEYDLVSPLPSTLLAGSGSVRVELRRVRTKTERSEPAGTPVIVLRTADDARCDAFIAARSPIEGPFFGVAGSTAAWKADSYTGVGQFANALVAISDDRGDIRALYEHAHNVNMDSDFRFVRLVNGTEAIPLVTSTPTGDGEADAFTELFGSSPSGAPQTLLSVRGTGPAPHAIADVTITKSGAKPELDVITSKSKGKTPMDCPTADCLVCRQTHWIWDAKTATFQRGASAPSPCP